MLSIDAQYQLLKSTHTILDKIDIQCRSDLNLLNLYRRLKNLARDRFDSNERIVITITGDVYNEYTPAGVGFQSLQTIINTVDISNFFIEILTTNTEATEEYQWTLKNISSDPVPFKITICSGDYQRWTDETFHLFTKQMINQQLDTPVLTERHEYLLFKSKTFCILPWTHMMLTPDGEVRSCCGGEIRMGDSNKQSLKTIWNGEPLRELRRSMLNDIPVSNCHICYQNEKLKKTSLRTDFNRDLAHRIYKVDFTHPNGTLNEFTINHIDTRFNNLCNLACRSCGTTYSSSWHQPAVDLKIIDKSTPALLTATSFDQLLENLDTVDIVYFAGGEPLINQQCYELMEQLIKQGKTDVKLIFNTNFTQTKLKNWNIFDLWRHFKNISVAASLDGMFNRGEYLRVGTHWDTVVENRRTMIELLPNIDFFVTATTGLINALHIPDFHQNWVNQELIKPEDFRIQILYYPLYQSLSTAPLSLKKEVQKKYNQHLEWLRPLDKLGRATSGFQSIIEFIDSSTDQHDADLFWLKVNELDQYYSTHLLTTFPELQAFLYG